MDDVPWTSTPLVGRSSELAALLSAVDEAKTRRAGAILLSGDAGVGKTRMLDEVATGAHERGFGVLVGHCTDFGDAGLPYLPFTEIFGRLAGERPDLVDSVLTNFPAIGRLLPTHRLIGAQAVPQEGQLDRAALFDAVLGAFTALSTSEPLVVIIEDAHWADDSSRDLIGFLLTRLTSQRLALVVSYRSDDLHRRHPLRRPIAEWSRNPRVRRVSLLPLDAADSRTLLDRICSPSRCPSWRSAGSSSGRAATRSSPRNWSPPRRWATPTQCRRIWPIYCSSGSTRCRTTPARSPG